MTCKNPGPMALPCRCCAEREEDDNFMIWVVALVALPMVALAFFAAALIYRP